MKLLFSLCSKQSSKETLWGLDTVNCSRVSGEVKLTIDEANQQVVNLCSDHGNPFKALLTSTVQLRSHEIAVCSNASILHPSNTTFLLTLPSSYCPELQNPATMPFTREEENKNQPGWLSEIFDLLKLQRECTLCMHSQLEQLHRRIQVAHMSRFHPSEKLENTSL